MTARILVVDDEPDLEPLIQRRFRRDVRQGHYAFEFARDGAEALARVKQDKDIDVLLCDINMPNMDGLTLLENLQGVNPFLKTVMVSAYGDMPNIRSAMNHGAFDFVTKPIEFDDLRATIEKSLGEIATLRQAVEQRELAERAKFNLSRYFAPDIAETLAETDEAFGSPKEQQVAVLFADIVGFTAYSAANPPDRVFALLREFHAKMAEAVFSTNGTVDKYIGDGLMAAFGVPELSKFDACNALNCAHQMAASIKAWNGQRGARGEESINVAIGVHYGKAMTGNIGDERRLEYATIGETVNVASRLEAMARPLHCQIVASDSLIDAARQEAEGDPPILSAFEYKGPVNVRGQPHEITVWTANAASDDGLCEIV